MKTLCEKLDLTPWQVVEILTLAGKDKFENTSDFSKISAWVEEAEQALTNFFTFVTLTEKEKDRIRVLVINKIEEEIKADNYVLAQSMSHAV